MKGYSKKPHKMNYQLSLVAFSHIKGQAKDLEFHSHQHYELYFFHGRECKYLINNQIYDLKPGDMLFLDGLDLHKAHVTGNKELYVGMLLFDAMASLEKVIEFCHEANDVAKKLAEHGIKLYYHNHHIEFKKYDGKYLLDIIREEAPLLGFELDVHWVQRGGKNPVSVLKDYAGKVDLVHLKDYRVASIPPEAFDALKEGDYETFMTAFANIIQFAELGQGSLDLPEIIEQSIASGTRYLLVEQDDQYGRDPFDCLITSRDYLYNAGYKNLF